MNSPWKELGHHGCWDIEVAWHNTYKYHRDTRGFIFSKMGWLRNPRSIRYYQFYFPRFFELTRIRGGFVIVVSDGSICALGAARLCECVCLCVCVCVCVCAHVCVCMCACASVCACVCVRAKMVGVQDDVDQKVNQQWTMTSVSWHKILLPPRERVLRKYHVRHAPLPFGCCTASWHPAISMGCLRLVSRLLKIIGLFCRIQSLL